MICTTIHGQFLRLRLSDLAQDSVGPVKWSSSMKIFSHTNSKRCCLLNCFLHQCTVVQNCAGFTVWVQTDQISCSFQLCHQSILPGPRMLWCILTYHSLNVPDTTFSEMSNPKMVEWCSSHVQEALKRRLNCLFLICNLLWIKASAKCKND